MLIFIMILLRNFSTDIFSNPTKTARFKTFDFATYIFNQDHDTACFHGREPFNNRIEYS